jgi:hypothetical protein
MKTKTKPITKDFSAKADARLRGDGAPVVTELDYKTSLMKAMAYYNSTMDNSARGKAVINYIKRNNRQFYDVFNTIPDYELLTVSSLIIIKEKGEYLSPSDEVRLSDMLNALYNRYKAVDKPKEDDKPKAPVISIEQRVIDAARNQSELIDYAIDSFMKTRIWNFNTKAHLLSNNISGMVAKKIGEYYQNSLDEIEEAIKGEDEQLVEGYSFLSKSELKKFRDAIKSIVDDCAQHQVTVKKPRVTKAKPPAVIVKKLKYMFKHDLLNIKSCNPADIVGAKELWAYNIKYRKLVAYVADDSDALSVKGTTIINYSVAKSWSWTLRNPEKLFKDLTISKKNLNLAAKALTTKPTAPNGRINEETILLGAF